MYNYYDFLCPGNWNPKRGIRQRDPISPCIFIISIESLGRYIYYRAPKTGIEIKAAKNGPMNPYLMFVDDCMISVKHLMQLPGMLKRFSKIIAWFWSVGKLS